MTNSHPSTMMKKSSPGSPCLTTSAPSSNDVASRASATVSLSHLSRFSRNQRFIFHFCQEFMVLPKIDTLARNSSYIFLFLIVDPMRILRQESLKNNCMISRMADGRKQYQVKVHLLVSRTIRLIIPSQYNLDLCEKVHRPNHKVSSDSKFRN